ncbi:MAG: hypothetical protein Fur0025_04000 [Oscillatoriaceae cyanobacterium]
MHHAIPITDLIAGWSPQSDDIGPSTTMSQKYVCNVCGYLYNPAKGDPQSGIVPGTDFHDLPDDWVCPDCGASKDDFDFHP